MYMPQIIEQTGRSKRSFDIISKLYEQNAIMLFEEIDDEVSFKIITQLLYLDSIESDENIKLYINSPGGVVTSGLAIMDTINAMSRKVDTIGIGSCASMAAVLLLSGTGTRRGLKNLRVMLHSISGGFIGQYHDHKIAFEESKYIQERLEEIISDKTKLDIKDVKKMIERDKYLSTKECIKYNIIDSEV